MKGMFSGRQIKDLKGRGQKITRSQTALSAYNAITGKYGGIVDNAHYFHVGKGVWKKYSLDSDKTRTGKIAPSKAAWAERPNKFDWEGIDTKESKKNVTNKKPRFSVNALAKGKMTGRKGDGMKLTGKPVTKKVNVPTIRKPVDTRLADTRWAKFDSSMNRDQMKNKISLDSGTDYIKWILNRRVKNARIEFDGVNVKVYSSDPEQAFDAILNAFEKDNNGKNKVPLRHVRNKIYFRGFTISIHEQKGTFQPFTGEYKGYKYKVSAKPARIEYYVNGVHRVGMDETFNINQASTKYIIGMARVTINDRLKSKTGKEEINRVNKATNVKAVANKIRPPACVRTYRYASYHKPIPVGFDPGVEYDEVTVTGDDKLRGYRERPIAVITTCEPINKETLLRLQLLDIAKEKAKRS